MSGLGQKRRGHNFDGNLTSLAMSGTGRCDDSSPTPHHTRREPAPHRQFQRVTEARLNSRGTYSAGAYADGGDDEGCWGGGPRRVLYSRPCSWILAWLSLVYGFPRQF